jgi:hypothetical protein
MLVLTLTPNLFTFFSPRPPRATVMLLLASKIMSRRMGERVRRDHRAGDSLGPPPRVSVNLVPLLWTGVPTRYDKYICRFFGAPACRVFLIT